MRSTILKLGLGVFLASGCGSAAQSLRQELGPTPQEQLAAERAQCTADREHDTQVRLELSRQLSETRYELDNTKRALDASEQRRADAERELGSLRNEAAKKSDRSRR